MFTVITTRQLIGYNLSEMFKLKNIHKMHNTIIVANYLITKSHKQH